MLHELCQIYFSLIGAKDKNQIMANLSTYSALCGNFLLVYGFEFTGTTQENNKNNMYVFEELSAIRSITCERSACYFRERAEYKN